MPFFPGLLLEPSISELGQQKFFESTLFSRDLRIEPSSRIHSIGVSAAACSFSEEEKGFREGSRFFPPSWKLQGFSVGNCPQRA